MIENSIVETVDQEHERWIVLKQLEEWIEIPMIVLSVVWFILVLAELLWGEGGLFEVFGTIIWIIFIGEFVLRLVIAPSKLAFLRSNVIRSLSLLVPALRMFRVLQAFRILRAARGLRLLRIVGTAVSYTHLRAHETDS